MTAGEVASSKFPHSVQLGTIVREEESNTPEDSSEKIDILFKSVGQIFSDLRAGADVTSSSWLEANRLVASPGVKLHGSGFLISKQEVEAWGDQDLGKVIKPFCNGKDLVARSRNLFIIDFFGLSEQEASVYSKPFQKVLEEVKPERDLNRRKNRKDNWWLFGENVPRTRNSIKNLSRYIVTLETAKHRTFLFIEGGVLPDNQLTVIALDDAYFLGVLSSQIHIAWALVAGGTLEDRPRYNKNCFYPFPFPDPSPKQKQKIRELGEKLDAHRKRVQAQHSNVTITGMYNLLEKLRRGESFTDSDRTYNDKALVSTLKQIHDDLDAVVFEAYGWQPDISDDEILEKLVALNAERAEEERNGLVRWLRPEYQAPVEVQVQQTLTGVMEPEIAAIEPAEQKAWSKQPKEQLAAIQELLSTSQGEWTVDQIAAQFKGGGRAKKAVKENLERLEFFGYVICRTDEMGVTRWQFVEVQKTA